MWGRSGRVSRTEAWLRQRPGGSSEHSPVGHEEAWNLLPGGDTFGSCTPPPASDAVIQNLPGCKEWAGVEGGGGS